MRRDLAEQEVSEEVLNLIEKAINGIDFGSVTLIVQNSRVIQIERVEKIRLC